MSREYKRRQRWRRWSAAAQWVDPSSELPPPPGLADAGGRRLCNWFWGRYAWLPLLLRSHSWSLPRNPALSPFMAFSYLFTPSGLSLSHTSKHVPLLCYYFFFFLSALWSPSLCFSLSMLIQVLFFVFLLGLFLYILAFLVMLIWWVAHEKRVSVLPLVLLFLIIFCSVFTQRRERKVKSNVSCCVF